MVRQKCWWGNKHDDSYPNNLYDLAKMTNQAKLVETLLVWVVTDQSWEIKAFVQALQY